MSQVTVGGSKKGTSRHGMSQSQMLDSKRRGGNDTTMNKSGKQQNSKSVAKKKDSYLASTFAKNR